MALTDNINAYWKLDESSGNAADSVGSSTLVNSNIVLYTSEKINNGATFVLASSQYLSVADNAALSITGDISIAFWVKFTTLPIAGGTMELVTKWFTTTNNRSYRARLTENAGSYDLAFQADALGDAGSQTNYHYNGAFSTGTFYYIVGAFTAGTPKWDIYINGSAVSTTADNTGASAIFDSTASFALGAVNVDGSATEFLNGALDEVGIWSRVLGAGEVSTLYNGGAGVQYPFGAGASLATRKTLLGVGI